MQCSCQRMNAADAEAIIQELHDTRLATHDNEYTGGAASTPGMPSLPLGHNSMD